MLSVSKFTVDNKVFIEFHSQFCLVKDSTTRKVLLKGNLDPSSSLYQLPSPYSVSVSHSLQTNNPSKTGVAFSISNSNANMWHQCLGHPANKVVKNLASHCHISFYSNKEFDFCSSCPLGKSHKLPFPISDIVTNAPLDIIYSDIWGPFPIFSINGAQYYIHFVDNFSRYT